MLYNRKNGAEIHLVGTAHVSKASADEVRDKITSVKPATVFLELDEGRANRLMGEEKEPTFNFQDFMRKLVSSFGMALPQMAFKQMRRGMKKSLESWGISYGLEFEVAILEARKLNARIVYGDIRDDVTFKALKEAMSAKDLWTMLTSGRQAMNAMKGSDAEPSIDKEEAIEKAPKTNLSGVAAFMESMEEEKTRRGVGRHAARLRALSPKMAYALIDSRDEWMVRVLRDLEGPVVGVVGLGHLDGIERIWKQLDDQQHQLRHEQQQVDTAA